MVVAQALVDAATEKTTVATGDLMFIESGGTASRITVGNYTASIGVNDKLDASDVLDEDDMGDDAPSETKPPSQAAVQAYVASAGRFTSTAQTITSGGLLTVAHGLGERPGSVNLWIKCTTAENGYSIGDEIQPDSNSSGAATGRFNTIFADDTNIYLRFTNESTCFAAGNKTTGASNALTNASWELYLEARR